MNEGEHSAWNPLIAAAMERDVERVRALLAAGNAADCETRGATALHWVCRGFDPDEHGNDEFALTVDLLIRAGADPNARDERQRTPLHCLCWHWDFEDERDEAVRTAVRLLLDVGADPNGRDENGRTPLHESVGGNGANLVSAELLITGGADVNAQDDDGLTGLMVHYEWYHEYERVTPLLLSHGADPRIKDKLGRTAIDLMKALIRGEEPQWRQKWLSELPPAHMAREIKWSDPGEPGDDKFAMLELLVAAARRLDQADRP